MHQHDGRRRQLERPLHHLAYIDRRMVDGAGLLHLVGDDLIAFVQEQDRISDKLLNLLPCVPPSKTEAQMGDRIVLQVLGENAASRVGKPFGRP